MELSRSSFAHTMVRLGLARPHERIAPATSTPASPDFERALEHFAHGRWRDAYETLATLADAGDPEAARIAVLMAIRGPRLFGRSFVASPGQRRRWQALAGASITATPTPK